MRKRLIIKLITICALVLCLLLLACGCSSGTPERPQPTAGATLYTDAIVSKLSVDDVKPLKMYTDLIRHPFADVIARWGNNYTVIWNENAARPGELEPEISLYYPAENVAFTAPVNFKFESQTYYGDSINLRNCGDEEYLPYFVVSGVSFLNNKTLVKGIRIGDTLDQIAKKLGAAAVSRADYSSYTDTVDGRKVKIYKHTATYNGCFCLITLYDDVLQEVKFDSYLCDFKLQNDADATHGYNTIREALAYVNAQGLANYSIGDLAYYDYYYSPFFDTWSYRWQFNRGKYSGCYICVEDRAPYRVFSTDPFESNTFIFWQDGQFVHPLQTFLGKWRKPNKNNSYIVVKEIIIPTCEIIFDMCKDGVLIPNINTTLTPGFDSFDDLYDAEAYAMAGVQYGNDDDWSGFARVYGDYQPMSDFISLLFGQEVSYDGTMGRGGAPGLHVHIPYKGSYPPDGVKNTMATGSMEQFGRDDSDPEGSKRKVPDDIKRASAALINQYMNAKHDTEQYNVNYAGEYFEYLGGYYFAFEDTTYTVWKSQIKNNDFYLYVDSAAGTVIKEWASLSFGAYNKRIVYYDGTVYEGRSILSYSDSWYSNDGKIRFSLSDVTRGLWTIAKSDAVISSIDVELYSSHNDSGDNYYFYYNLFAGTSNPFFLAGYFSYSNATGGGTLHITNSNIKGFEMGIYPLYYDDARFGRIVFVEVESGSENVPIPETPSDNSKVVIRDRLGSIIGYIKIDANGNKTVTNRNGLILGYYKADRDVTTDVQGKILYQGDAAAALLFGNG